MKPSLFLSIAILFICTRAIAAEDDAPELQTRFGHYTATYTLNADSTHVETHDWTTKILQERAVEGSKRVSISYSTSIQKAEVLHAYTLKADGRRIDAPKSNFQLEVNSGKDKSAPILSDITTLSVVFPEVAVGDTVAFAYKLTQVEAIFPGHFSVMNTFSKFHSYDDVKIVVDAPASLWIQYAARQMVEKRMDKAGRIQLEWTLQNPSPAKSKRRDWSVYDVEQEPGFAVSTFKSYAQIADAYGVRAGPKAVVTERIQKMADELTQGVKIPREQARVLYDWVATNITYGGNCIGVGAVVPRDIAFILDNKMGDCKDHATLLQALLSAKGIESTQALVNAGSTFRLPKIPVVSTVNHVINYLPGLNMFVDSTSSSTPFGMLPDGDIGKPVLLVDGFKEGLTTPAPLLGSNRQHMKNTLRFQSDGSVKGEIDVAVSGIYAVNSRAQARYLSKDQQEEFMKNMFSRMGSGGSGKISLDDAKQLADSHHYRVQFDVRELIQIPGPSALPISPLFPTEGAIYHFASAAAQPEEDVETVCSSGYSVEEYIYQFPKNIKILSVPANMKIANDFLSYQATYQRKGNTLTVKRVMDDRTPGHICTPAIAAAYKKFMNQVSKNLKAQVIYQ